MPSTFDSNSMHVQVSWWKILKKCNFYLLVTTNELVPAYDSLAVMWRFVLDRHMRWIDTLKVRVVWLFATHRCCRFSFVNARRCFPLRTMPNRTPRRCRGQLLLISPWSCFRGSDQIRRLHRYWDTFPPRYLIFVSYGLKSKDYPNNCRV